MQSKIVIYRFEVYTANLNPTVGSEIQKTRPVVIVSPNVMNENANIVIVTPVTSKGRDYATRVNFNLEGMEAQIVVEQIRAIDKSHLGKKIGVLNKPIREKLLKILQAMFAE